MPGPHRKPSPASVPAPPDEGALATLRDDAHAQPAEDVLRRLSSRTRGLTTPDARSRFAAYGPNALVGIAPPSVWRVLWDQLRSTVVALLLAAAVLGALLGDVPESIAIGAVLLVNVVIGFSVEWRARNAMEALRKTDFHHARVVRDGVERRVPARELVPGDVLDLDPGEAISADARLIEVAELRVLEAALTGESEPISKRLDAVAVDAVLAERPSMVFKGTMVAAGTARAVVVATGQHTEIGRIGLLVAGTDVEDTPLEQRLAVLGRHLVWVSLGVAGLVTLLGIARDLDTWLMVQTGVALAIAAVPEGLPIVATICLALGMRRMVRRRALVRRLPAVETLGSVTVICTDKTGTLTANEMSVAEVWTAGRTIRVTGTGYAPVGGFESEGRPLDPASDAALTDSLRIAALANEAVLREEDGGWVTAGDPTEIALLTAARKAGLERTALAATWPETAEVPFSSERMWMASVRRAPGGGLRALVKGAPGRVLNRCTHWLSPDGEQALDAVGLAQLREIGDGLACGGLRVLALAQGTCGAGPILPGSIEGLVFVGFVGLLDAPAPGVRDAIAALDAAGIRPVMITGDHRLTAEAIALDLGIARGGLPALDGRELTQTTDDELVRRAGHTSVYSRVSPEQKLRIVAALQRSGEIVGMLGDGVNDAPALRKADIGVAMGGRGTDVAKETAGLVLQDDRFPTVVAAVEEGRVIFDNIRKFIFFLFSCNLSEVLILMLAVAAGAPIPLAPLQILWLNFVTDVFPALALATEPPEPDVLRRPPRDPDEAILSRPFLASLAGHAGLLTASALIAFAVARAADPNDLDHARTMTFMAVAFSQTLHALNARSDRPVLLGRRLFANPWMWGSFVLVAGLQAAALWVPSLAQILGLVPLSLVDWLVVGLASLFPLVAGQIWRAARRR